MLFGLFNRSRYFCFTLSILLVLFLSACTQTATLAPVLNGNGIEAIPAKGYYRVQHGDTLYSIAFRYGLDYEYLAKRNRIEMPYKIHTGQKIFLLGSHAAAVKPILPRPFKTISEVPSPVKAPLKTKSKPKPIVENREPTKAVTHWNWPAHGQLIGRFCDMNHGINISGCLGAPIFATAAGKVVYCGNGLRSYGNLIIIKHNRRYLSAYAHNSRVLVRAGELVKSGQKIAEMGDTGTHRVMLHFEIRRNGQSVNPMEYLR